MSLWHRIRGEVAGAWRSVGYDLGRRPGTPPGSGDPRQTGGAATGDRDVTSTGLHTFPGSLVDLPAAAPRTDARPPRRFVAVTAFCVLALSGAGGSYLVATTIFSVPRGVVPQAPPQAAVERPIPVDGTAGGEAGMGTVPPKPTRSRTRPADPTGPAGPSAGTAAPGTRTSTVPPVRAASGEPPVPATERRPRPRTVAPEKTRQANPTPCDCRTPPVPTPTGPAPAPAISVSPSAGQPSGTPGDTGRPQPSGSASPAPQGSASGDSTGHRHRRAHRS
ncbi:hypothetical protein [Actinoplanes sp. DH11]|uniref:hypothetical protein n=1 Tax=Actinoplanes sp. DH11 TaxID=2857011 RepID=UPI001E4C9DA9|nr:hypothetical protein [Actinoplanes sp. DH11]